MTSGWIAITAVGPASGAARILETSAVTCGVGSPASSTGSALGGWRCPGSGGVSIGLFCHEGSSRGWAFGRYGFGGGPARFDLGRPRVLVSASMVAGARDRTCLGVRNVAVL